VTISIRGKNDDDYAVEGNPGSGSPFLTILDRSRVRGGKRKTTNFFHSYGGVIDRELQLPRKFSLFHHQ